MKKYRLLWVDVLKGIGMILVILGHIYNQDNIMNYYINSFHMPLFFVISGYLFNFNNAKSNKEYIYEKFKGLFVPFIGFVSLLYIYWRCIEKQFRNSDCFDIGPSWFLLVMFCVTSLVYPLKDKLKNQYFTIGTLIITIIINIVIKEIFPNIDKTVFIWILRITISISWFLIGILVKNIIKKESNAEVKSKKFTKNKLVSISTIIGISVIQIIFSLINGTVSIFSGEMGKYYLLYYITGILGTIALMILSKEIIKKNIVLEFISKYSIIIMATHEPIKRICIGIVNRFGLSYEFFKNTYIPAVVLTIVILLIEYIVINIFKCIKAKTKNIKVMNFMLDFVKE